jgi:tripartite-type tricarboxylate transporter receptor subunit TctC
MAISFENLRTLETSAMHASRTRFVAALFSITAAFMSSGFAAQTYPDRPIRIVVPYVAGGGVDTAARLVGQPLGEHIGQSVLIDNRPGAATNIGSDMVAKAKPDGYTLLLANASQVANVSLYSKMPYDLQKDLASVVLIGSAPLIMLIHPSLPVKSVKDVIALAKSRPDELNYASAGIGSPTHIAPELFKWMAGVRITHIPYKGGSQAVIDLIAGRITLYFAATSTGLPLVQSGKARAIGVTGLKRFAPLPNVPTISEGGLPGYEIGNWFALLAPGATPKDVIAKLNTSANAALKKADVVERLNDVGVEVMGGSTQALDIFLKKEIVTYEKIIRAANIKPE